MLSLRSIIVACPLSLAFWVAGFAAADDPFAGWSDGVEVRAVDSDESRHSIHAYFNASPESADGRRIVFFTSTTREGESGEIRMLDRIAGTETVVAEGVVAEDAHRAACQQWLNDGKTIAYHELRDGHWRVLAYDVETKATKVLAQDRQLGFGAASLPWAPIYGCHWNPGPSRDLELVHVETGKVRTPVSAARVVAEYGDWTQATFGTTDLSIFFPVVSPDGSKVFFKMSRPSGGEDFRSSKASYREGKVVFDLERGEFVRLIEQWGHPSWSPDSRGIFEKGNILFDLESGESRRFAPSSPSNHPSLSPDGKVFVTDADVSRRPFGSPGQWAVIVGDVASDRFVVIHQFDNTGGARSWRPSHPHPVFSADGRRIYYNVSDGERTRLFMAERSDEAL
jgi:Tol biopolymer transport system component